MAIEDKRVRRTKKLLRQALAELMREKEFKNITVSDVVRRADINRGTFYVYYRDVYDLREKVENEMVDTLRGTIEAALPEVVAQASMRPVIEQAVRYLEENHDLAFVLLRDNGVGSFEDKLMALMEECSRQLKPPKNEADQFPIWFVAAGCIGLLKRWMMQPVPTARDEVLDRLDDLLCRILQTA